MTHKQRQIKAESFAPVTAPAALLPRVPTPKPPAPPHPDLDVRLFFTPGCILQRFAAGLATAPGAAISETRWGGQPSHFGSPASLPFSSTINIRHLSGMYDLHQQNAGANTRVLCPCCQPNAHPIQVGSALEDPPLVLLRAPHDGQSHRTTAAWPIHLSVSWQTTDCGVSVYLKGTWYKAQGGRTHLSIITTLAVNKLWNKSFPSS